LYQTLWADATFHRFIFTIDQDLAAQCRAAGCPRCGEKVDSATYSRKPRGVPEDAKVYYERRFSFTCRRCETEKQRHRTTPPSVRFLGRKVYLAMIVALISAMHNGLTDHRLDRLAETLRVDRRTVARWRMWWLETFSVTPFWRARSADFMPSVDIAGLPGSLLDRFKPALAEVGGEARNHLAAFLRFLGPITGGSDWIARSALAF
jgi:hypothetical protein